MPDLSAAPSASEVLAAYDRITSDCLVVIRWAHAYERDDPTVKNHVVAVGTRTWAHLQACRLREFVEAARRRLRDKELPDA